MSRKRNQLLRIGNLYRSDEMHATKVGAGCLKQHLKATQPVLLGNH